MKINIYYAIFPLLLTLSCDSSHRPEDLKMCLEKAQEAAGTYPSGHGTCAYEKETALHYRSLERGEQECYVAQKWDRMAELQSCKGQCGTDKLSCLDTFCKEEESPFAGIMTTNGSQDPCDTENYECIARCRRAKYFSE